MIYCLFCTKSFASNDDFIIIIMTFFQMNPPQLISVEWRTKRSFYVNVCYKASSNCVHFYLPLPRWMFRLCALILGLLNEILKPVCELFHKLHRTYRYVNWISDSEGFMFVISRKFAKLKCVFVNKECYKKLTSICYVDVSEGLVK